MAERRFIERREEAEVTLLTKLSEISGPGNGRKSSLTERS